MAEWLKAHAWKACIPQGIQGSNPCLSATTLFWNIPRHPKIKPKPKTMLRFSAYAVPERTMEAKRWTGYFGGM